jgi:predicted transcriptional regulator
VTSYRDKIDVIAVILDIANGSEVSQAKILNKANISHNLFKEYLSFLRQYGLIDHIRHQKTFKTTTKGLDFLNMFNKMKDLILSPADLSSEFSVLTMSKTPTFPIST